MEIIKFEFNLKFLMKNIVYVSKKAILFWLLIESLLILSSNGHCIFNNKIYEENSNWELSCQNCTCLNSVPVCNEIQCKYELCESGKLFVLNNDKCCPSCEQPKISCHYDGHLIQHNTEFSPKLCETCKCKNGQMECINSCSVSEQSEEKSDQIIDLYNKLPISSLNQRKTRIRQHNNNKINSLFSNKQQNDYNHNDKPVNDAKSVCIHDNKIHQFNTTWSPFKCTLCRCSFNSIVDCFVKDCPTLKNCLVEMKPDECCPTCKEEFYCTDDQIDYKNGDHWTKKNDPCTHCSCVDKKVNCYTETCPVSSCNENEILLTESNRCCPRCVSKLNCDYYGKIHYNGEMWYNSGCQHCACNNGKISCMNIQCESNFCLKDEILVKKKDDCCIECRKPKICSINENLSIKENEFWSPDNVTTIERTSKSQLKTCKMCQCTENKLECYSKSCKDLKYPSFSYLKISLNQKKQLNARTIPFFADIIKSMNKKSLVFVTAGPKFGKIYNNNKTIEQFTVGDVTSSKIYYKLNQNEFDDKLTNLKTNDLYDPNEYMNPNDYIVLSFVTHETGHVHNILIIFEIKDDSQTLSEEDTKIYELTGRSLKTQSINYKSDNERSVRGYNDKILKESMTPSMSNFIKIQPRKTIFVIPGEAIKLTSNELKPKNLSSNFNQDNLIYFLVSGNLKYGELKLKKALSYDEVIPSGWTQVNDIYLEKTVKEFSQKDLDNGNVWYEPLSDFSSSSINKKLSNENYNCNQNSSSKGKKCQFGDLCEETNDCDNILSFPSANNTPGPKYDHCMFEVYDQEQLDLLISKEIIHFSIQNEIINETVLGLEVIENQITPLTFSNFDIAGIDSNRDYLIYRIIKSLEKNQGHLEHTNTPGIAIETFSQNDLNKGLVLYHAPKKIGVYSIEFSFTFIVTNDNRSDTFPETPFHIKVSPSNDQAPFFKENSTQLSISKSGSLSLSRELFDFEDPDTAIDNIFFSIENPTDNFLIELRIKDKRYVITKTDSFTIQEIREGTFRVVHKGSNSEKDSLKITVSDGKHMSHKTINLNIKLIDKMAPRLENRTTLFLNTKEGLVKTIKREHLSFVDDKSPANEIVYQLKTKKKNIKNEQFEISGKLFLKNELLTSQSKFTQADIDAKHLKYEAPKEIGATQISDFIYFSVQDKEENIVKDQLLTINIEPIDNQFPLVDIFQPVEVLEGSYLILNESYIKVTDSDSPREQLNIIIDSQPNFGFIVNTLRDTKLNSFPLKDLKEGLFIRYVQSDHQNKEPITDSFIFHASDGVNESPTYKFVIKIIAINDEPPVVLFNPLLVESNQKTLLSNSTFFIVDFDTKDAEIAINVEEFPKNGKLFLNNKQMTRTNAKFSYADVLNNLVSYKLDTEASDSDDIKFRITDGNFTVISTFYIRKFTSKPSDLNLDKNDLLDSLVGDKLPPTVTQNMGLKVEVGETVYLTKSNLDVRDDDTNYKNLHFYVTNQPKYGNLENILQPGKAIKKFSYEDLEYNRIRYLVNKSSFKSKNDGNTNSWFSSVSNKEDFIDIKISDGKNDVTTSLIVSIVDNSNKYTVLKSILSLRVKEFERKKITSNEIKLINQEISDDGLRIVITNPPQYGVLEKLITKNENNLKSIENSDDKHILINTGLNQTLNLILKFNKNTSNQDVNILQYNPINEFTMADIKAGLIYYRHVTTGVKIDRFGFLVSDGINNIFVLEGSNQVSTVQVFSIYIDSATNLPPKIEKNLGLDYLQPIDSFIGRLIAKNDLLITDQDDLDTEIFIEITSQPIYGLIVNKDKMDSPISRFSQDDLNQNKIYYTLREKDDFIANDYFFFDVVDSAKNRLKENRFDLKWSILNFDQNEINVFEEDGKARVHVKKEGNLKHFSMATCKTISDSAKSNKDIKQFDFVYTTIKLEFNEDESYKACDIIIQKDSNIEPVESFYVVLEDPKNSIIGSNAKVKVNILDKKKENLVEFENTRFDIQESDKFISIPIIRSGDLSKEMHVECFTKDETAINNLDYFPRNKNGANYQIVKIPQGEIYGFCDVEIIDDEIHELNSETFKIILMNPSFNTKIGTKSEARVTIVGPNDIFQSDNCKTVFYTVSENSNQLSFEITREKSSIMEPLDVLITTVESSKEHIRNYFDFYKKTQMNTVIENQNNFALTAARENNFTKNFISVPSNITIAIPYEDFIPIKEILKFQPGELTKRILVNILNDDLNPMMEGLKIFTIDIKPIINESIIYSNSINNASACFLVNPDFINIVIEDIFEDSISVGFNVSSITVNEPTKRVHVPIIRNGDLYKPFSVICYTRQLTAIENKDYIGRYSLEQSRIYFEPGEKVKNCTVEIVNDLIFESEETFQMKLTDIRGPENAKFTQNIMTTVTISNDEDSSVISLLKKSFNTEEPSGHDATVIKPITIVRTGDLSRTSIVRVSTADKTATAGLDYKPKTEILTFNPGVSALDFEIEILYDDEKEPVEIFSINLGPKDPISGFFGKITTANVFIYDNNVSDSDSLKNRTIDPMFSHDKQKKDTPFVKSLHSFLFNQTDFDDFYAVSDEPLICFHPCNANNPFYDQNQVTCKKLLVNLKTQSFDELQILYSWEISAPNEFGMYSSYVKLTENTLFANVNQSVLEPVYYRPRFRVRCTTQYLRSNINYQDGNFVSKSNTVEILTYKPDKQCPKLNNYTSSNIESLDNLSKNLDNSWFILKDNIMGYNIATNLITDKSQYIAKADYISADFITSNPSINLEYLNYIRLTINIPHIEGSFPLISTKPLHSYRHLLTDTSDIFDHVCSNFNQSKNNIKFGFQKSLKQNHSSYDQQSAKYRNAKTVEFYDNLDSSKCHWEYVAFYDISELTTNCHAQILSDSDIRDDQLEKSYLSIKIPLFISYIFPSYQASWSTLEFKSQIDASIVYKTISLEKNNKKNSEELRYNPNYLKQNRNDYIAAQRKNNSNLFSFKLYKVHLTQQEKLVIEFITSPLYKGQFMQYSSNFSSSFNGPDSDGLFGFHLELLWTQFGKESPKQMWRATSKSYLTDYTGNYSASLVPCFSNSNISDKYPFICNQKDPLNYIIPIRMSDIQREVPVRYSYDTNLILSINDNNLFDGYFRKGDSVIGTIVANRNHNEKRTTNRFDLEKVYLCSSDVENYVPLYDPDGTLYNKGPQFGCIRPDKSLTNRFIILDKNAKEYRFNKKRENSFSAEFISATNSSEIKSKKIIGGFKFNIDGIFSINNSSNKIWFIQVVFSTTDRHKRSSKFYNLNNGTHIQTIQLSNEPQINFVRNFTEWLLLTQSDLIPTRSIYKNKNQVFSFQEIFTKFLLPIFMFIIFILFLIITVIFCRKEKMKKKFFQLPTMDYITSKPCGSLKSCGKDQNTTTKLSCKKIIKSKTYNNSIELDCDKKPFSKLKNLFNKTKTNGLAKNKTFRFNFKNKSKSSLVTFQSVPKDEPVCNSINYKEEMLDEKINFDISKINELNSKLNLLNKENGNIQSSNNCSIYNSSFQSNSKKSQKTKTLEKTDLIKSLKKTESTFNCSEIKTPVLKLNRKSLNLRNFLQKFNFKKSKIGKQKKSILKINHSNSQSSYFRNQPAQSHSGILKSFSNQSFNKNANSKHRNNYLYFNYNNNKMHYLNTDNDLVINDSNTFLNTNLNNETTVSNQNLLVSTAAKNSDSAAVSTLNSNSNQANTSLSLSTSTKYILASKFKRLSGTEV